MELASVLALVAVAVILGFAWVRKLPMVMGLVIANFAVFLISAYTASGPGLTIAGSPHLNDLAARVSDLTELRWWRWYTILTATFLHADVVHLIGNMLVLLLIGLPFEDRIRRNRLLAIYFLSSIVAVLLHGLWILFMQGGGRGLDVPLVGASGAVFGLLGAFAAMYPRDQIPMFLVFILLPRVPVWLAAVVLMGLEGFALFGGAATRVAHAAHLGGAVGGVIFALLLKPERAYVEPKKAPRRLDYDVLERLARDESQRRLVTQLRQNEDEPETQAAWLERLLPTLTCAQCGQPLAPRGRTRLECPNGHQEQYAT
jgi:membrane associated rhomboid family serine protease